MRKNTLTAFESRGVDLVLDFLWQEMPQHGDIGYQEINRVYEMIQKHFSEPVKPTKLKCSECGEPQFNTTSGPVCSNGHGGAEGVE